jgi:hypothetical protein
MDRPSEESGSGEFGDPGWRPEENSGESSGESQHFDPERESAGSTRSSLPTLSLELPSGNLGLRGLVHLLVGAAIVVAGGAYLALQHEARGIAEILALFALVIGALAAPAVSFARRLARYPRTGMFVLGKRGFSLPWLNSLVPGPEGPWEAVRSYAVRRMKRGRVLLLEVAAGRFWLTDQLLGDQAFDAVVDILDRALGPGGVLLGTLVRLPIHPTDRRSFFEREVPRIVSLALAAMFVLLASQASLWAIRILAGLAAIGVTLAGSFAQSLETSPRAELVLALDGLVVPLPDDLRKTVKLPFDTLRRGAVEDVEGRVSLVIEHRDGRLLYPLDWFDAREAKEFARQLADRAG